MTPAAAPSQRGGARNTGMALRANTINGIQLRWRRHRGVGRPIPYLCGYWADADGVQRQNSASLEANSIAAAIEHALGPRRAAGMPVPGIGKVRAAVNRFLEKGPV